MPVKATKYQIDQLVNEAVQVRRSKGVEVDLEATLESLRAYRKSDPNFERAIADYVDAEASLKEASGRMPRVGEGGSRGTNLK
jgi:hypothetical protein